MATVCVSGLLVDKIDAAAHAGFDGIELFEPDLVASDLTPEEVRRLVNDRGMSVEILQPFRDVEGRTDEQFGDVLRQAEGTFELMTRLGVDLLLVCSNARSDAIDDDERAAIQLRSFADAAGRHGIRIAFEALAWGTHVNTWEHAWDLVERVDRPNVGLCLDSFHTLVRASTTRLLRRVPGDKIFFVQLADAPTMVMDVLPWSRHHRVFPAEGSLAVVPMVADIAASGYRGPWSLEVFNDVYRQSDPWVTAAAAMRSLDGVLAASTERGAADVVRLRGATMASAEPTGITQVLRALGFAPSDTAGRWHHGDTVILVSTDADAGPGVVTHVDLVTDHAPPRRPSAVDRPGVEPPVPISWSLTATERDDEALTEHRPTITLDHVTVTVPFERFSEAIGYVRSDAGLDVVTVNEDAGPFGLVRRAQLSARGGGATVGLVSSVLPRGRWRPRQERPQHLSFAVHDLQEAAAALERHGVSVLPIPDNYYAALERAGVPDGLDLDVMRRHQMMVDCDMTGCFLHLCTDMIGSVFIEVIERIDGRPVLPAGAGVRMAAHVRARRRRERPRSGETRSGSLAGRGLSPGESRSED